MAIVKVKIENTLYDVITFDQLRNNLATYMKFIGSVAVDFGDGLLYPIRHPNDTRPGCYITDGITIFKPPYGSDTAIYSKTNQIDFSQSKNYGDFIKAQQKLNNSERAILTTIDNVTIPEIGPNDTPAMKALKECIVAKHIDLDKYDYRFGTDNYPNDKRLLKRDTITFPKLKAYADALDVRVTITLEDMSPDVPNPMNKVITATINGDGSGLTIEGE